MSLTLISDPVAEPVTLDVVKAHLRIDGSGEDDLIGRMAIAARMHIEQIAALALMPQTLAWRIDQWPGEALLLPRGPVTGVSEFAVLNEDETWQPLPAEEFSLVPGLRGRVTVTGETPSPERSIGGIRIVFTAGFADQAAVPAPLVQAICQLTAHYHARREPFENLRFYPVPQTVAALIEPYRLVRL